MNRLALLVLLGTATTQVSALALKNKLQSAVATTKAADVPKFENT